MLQFNKLWANTRYEVITLLRGWFFRISSSLTLIILLTMSITLLSNITPVPRTFKGFSSSIPYANILLLNIVQVVIVIFISGDFFKRDTKLNTSEVFYIRSMTNATYLIGKALGVFLLFLGMIIITILYSLVIHLLFSETTFNIIPYLLYPVLISLPSFIFMIGLSFFLMRLIRNQAVVVLVLLGYFALTLFYLSVENYFIYDFMAWRIPLAYSDFTGIANLNQILLQRGIYFFSGILFILLTILFFNRLSQSNLLQKVLSALSICLFVLIFSCIYFFLDNHAQDQNLRTRMHELNQEYLNKPNISPIAYDIIVHHENNQLINQSLIRFKNDTAQPLSKIYFSLNPGFKVSAVIYNGNQLQFEHKAHILDVFTPGIIKAGQVDSIIVRFQGSINEAACFTEIPEIIRKEPFSIWLYQIPKKHAFVTDNYVLLSPETLWYPKIGLPAGVGFPEKMNRPFINFNLIVQTDTNLTAISQGESKLNSDGQFEFSPEYPLTCISLVIGPYVRQTIQVDSIEFGLYTLPNHNYYLEYLPTVGDTLRDIIRDTFQDFEVHLDLNYPYKRLNLIEVPLQYYAYPRLWTVAQEIVQPEQIWIQEDAASIAPADFKMSSRSMERRLDRSNQTLTELETQTTILTNFFNYTFLGKIPGRFFFGGIPVSYTPDYNIFPNFYTYNYYISDDKWQIFNSALEAFLYDRVRASSNNRPAWLMEGLSEEEEASILLRDHSLSELLKNSENPENLPSLIKQKGSFLVKLLQNESGTESFNSNLKKAVTEYRFTDLTLNKFFNVFETDSHSEFDDFLKNWYHGKVIPSFYVYNVELYKVLDGDRIRSQAIFTISNLEDVSGLIEVSFRYSRRGRGMPISASGDEEPPILYRIDPQQTKEIGILLDEEPRAISINFLIAKNLPLIYSKRFEDAELNEKKKAFHGESILPEPPATGFAGEIIVDNEDSGFILFNPPYESILKQMIHANIEEEKEIQYSRFEWWSPPPQWTLIKNAAFFGTYIHSAYYIRSGDGKRHVSWKADIRESGIYDIYVYMFNKDNFWRGRRRRQGSMFGEFEYHVKHDSGEEVVSVSADEAPEGWNYLGSWYLSSGQTEVVLTNKSDGNIIIADAIKWVKN